MRTEVVLQEVRRLARALLPEGASDIAARVTEQVLRSVPDLAPAGVPGGTAVVRESTNQTIGAIFSGLAFAIAPSTVEPPAGTQELSGNLTAAGGDVTHLLHAYRVGHQLLWQSWSDHVRAHVSSNNLIPEVLAVSSEHMFAFIDQTCQRITADFPARGEGPVPLRATDRSATIRQLLGSAPVNMAVASARLGYDLNGHHIALVAHPITEHANVRTVLEALLDVAALTAVVVPAEDGNWWAWLGCPIHPDGFRIEQVARAPIEGVLVGMGSPGQGREGFRRSHQQALQAQWIGRLTAQPQQRVIQHHEIEPVALLCNDPDSARSFSAGQLGDLARRDDTGRRLRATVRTVLANGSSRSQAAQELHVHPKTVAYRLEQAESVLGRPLGDNTFSLQAALLIDEALHGP